MAHWSVTLDGLTASTDTDDDVQLLTQPEGLGLPMLRVDDIQYPQRDGAEHNEDWYEPRIITFPEVAVRVHQPCDDGKQLFDVVQAVKRAWRRRQEDVEATVMINGQGPFGIIGRPRVAQVNYTQFGNVATMMLRFDARDHLLYQLGEQGLPKSGSKRIFVDPGAPVGGRFYPRTYPLTYGVGESSVVTAVNGGDIETLPVLRFRGQLTRPVLTNQTTGETIGLDLTLAEGDFVEVDVRAQTVLLNGTASRYYALTGDSDWGLEVGDNNLVLTSDAGGDNGEVMVTWRAVTA